jgi:hypothetical protein
MVAGRRIASPIRARALAMAIGPRGRRSRLAGFAGRRLPARGRKFALELKQPRFDRTGTTKSPQQACQPMNERKLDHGSRINTADEGTLERSVGSNVFEIVNDGLVSKPITPTAAA